MPRGKNYVNQGKGVALQASKKKVQNMQQCAYQGSCTRKDCIYRHDATSSTDKAKKNNEPCMAFLAGTCTFSVQGCRKRHPGKEEAEKLIAKYSTMQCRHGENCKTKGCLYIHGKSASELYEPSGFPPLTQNTPPLNPPSIPGSAWRQALPTNVTGTVQQAPRQLPQFVQHAPRQSSQAPNYPKQAWGRQVPPTFLNNQHPGPIVNHRPLQQPENSGSLNINAKEFVPYQS